MKTVEFLPFIFLLRASTLSSAMRTTLTTAAPVNRRTTWPGLSNRVMAMIDSIALPAHNTHWNEQASNSKPSSYCHQLSLLTEHIMSLPFSSFVRPQMSALLTLSYSSVLIKLKYRSTRNLTPKLSCMGSPTWPACNKTNSGTLDGISNKGGVLGIRLYRITLDYDKLLISTLAI